MNCIDCKAKGNIKTIKHRKPIISHCLVFYNDMNVTWVPWRFNAIVKEKRHWAINTRTKQTVWSSFCSDTKFVKLQIVPASLQEIIFVAFLTDCIGAHMNANCMYMQIRTRCFWPNMFKYIKRMCKTCPGCKMKNWVRNRKKSLCIHFQFFNSNCLYYIYCDS